MVKKLLEKEKYFVLEPVIYIYIYIYREREKLHYIYRKITL